MYPSGRKFLSHTFYTPSDKFLLFSPNVTCRIVEPVDFRTGKKLKELLTLLAARLLGRRMLYVGSLRFRALLSFALFLSFSLTLALIRDLRFLTLAGTIDNYVILEPVASFSNPSSRKYSG